MSCEVNVASWAFLNRWTTQGYITIASEVTGEDGTCPRDDDPGDSCYIKYDVSASVDPPNFVHGTPTVLRVLVDNQVVYDETGSVNIMTWADTITHKKGCGDALPGAVTDVDILILGPSGMSGSIVYSTLMLNCGTCS